MLQRAFSRRICIISTNHSKFSNKQTHDEHDYFLEHHDYSVHIDKNAKLIKYISNPKLISITGVQDQYFKLQPRLTDDPYHHVSSAPFLSFNSLTYTNDPWYHDDSHEPYNSAPDRGYLDGSDPLDSRHLAVFAFYYIIGVFVSIMQLMGATDPKMRETQARLYMQKNVRDYVTRTLDAKNTQLNKLIQLEQKLKNQL